MLRDKLWIMTVSKFLLSEFFEAHKGFYMFWNFATVKCDTGFLKGRCKNLKVVSKNFPEIFNDDDVRANDVIQWNQHRKEEKYLSSIVITDVKLAS